jgi:hypothetical protein
VRKSGTLSRSTDDRQNRRGAAPAGAAPLLCERANAPVRRPDRGNRRGPRQRRNRHPGADALCSQCHRLPSHLDPLQADCRPSILAPCDAAAPVLAVGLAARPAAQALSGLPRGTVGNQAALTSVRPGAACSSRAVSGAQEERSTTNPAAAFSRTASMPSTTPLIVVNRGETATTFPSPAVNRKRNASPSRMISKVPATAVVSLAHASLPRPIESRSVIQPTPEYPCTLDPEDSVACACADRSDSYGLTHTMQQQSSTLTTRSGPDSGRHSGPG